MIQRGIAVDNTKPHILLVLKKKFEAKTVNEVMFKAHIVHSDILNELLC